MSASHQFFTIFSKTPTQKYTLLTVALERLKKLTEEKKVEYQKAELDEQKRFHQTMGDVTHQVCLNELKIIITTTAFQLADAIQNIIKNKDLSKEEYDAYMGVIAVTEIAISDKYASIISRVDDYSKNPILEEGIQNHLKTLKGAFALIFGFVLVSTGVASGGFLGCLCLIAGCICFGDGLATLQKNFNAITVPANYLNYLHENLKRLPSVGS